MSLQSDLTGLGLSPGLAAKLTNATGYGLLLPSLTTTQRDTASIGGATTGTLIYNSTTNKLNFYAASAWEAVTSA